MLLKSMLKPLPAIQPTIIIITQNEAFHFIIFVWIKIYVKTYPIIHTPLHCKVYKSTRTANIRQKKESIAILNRL